MKTIKFKCTLLSDVILNVKSASQGNNSTLDFIPGNNFLGIAAKRYRDFGDNAMYVFHSGHVRFGDAHPGASGIRSLRIPAAMFYPKLSSPDKECYIHHLLQTGDTPVQLKQCRQGFYVFSGDHAVKIQEHKRFAIKSAYDRDKRRSADEMMYGYESLAKGAEMYFEVETDDDSLSESLTDALCGIHQIGRSRTAQYGLVKIEQAQYDEMASNEPTGLITVYADGRLIFTDADGMPTLQPTPQQLGISGGRIAWDKSQIRTFKYAPWNSMRQCFDTDRCGIEKGSVIVVEGGKLDQNHSQYVGSYRNEGFGKVIYNPAFLLAHPGGKAKCTIKSEPIAQTPAPTPVTDGNGVLIKYLLRRRNEDILTADSYRTVNEFIKKYGRNFLSDNFAAQWGSIRSIVTQCKSKKDVYDKLFAPKTGYLKHGQAAAKWEEYHRCQILETFVNGLNDNNTVVIMINLSSEMAKLCRKGGLKK